MALSAHWPCRFLDLVCVTIHSTRNFIEARRLVFTLSLCLVHCRTGYGSCSMFTPSPQVSQRIMLPLDHAYSLE